MLRLGLFLLLSVVVARAFWHLVDGIVQGVSGGPPATRTPPRSVHMARDPVCGTYVIPDRAVTLSVGTRQLFFCSTACRDKYRARTA